MQDALTKKDITLALVTNKRTVGFNDPDIEINVEKRSCIHFYC
jgi:chemotaxis protein MotB